MNSPILNSIIQSSSDQSQPILLFHFPAVSPYKKNRILYIPQHPKFRSTLRFAGASSNSAAATNFRGWEDDFQQLSSDWASSGESFELRDLVSSIGIHDKKYGFTFLLGIVSAFALSRVRVSYIALVPATAVVFAAGFSFGFVRGGGFDFSTVKRKGKESNSKAYNIEEFLSEFEVKVGDLKNSVLKAMDSKEIKLDDLEHYADVIEAMNTYALNMRNAVESEIDGVTKLDNRKPSSKKGKQIGEVGSELVRFLGGMLGGRKAPSSKPNRLKEKENPKQEATVILSSTRIKEGVDKNVSESKGSNSNNRSVSSQGVSSKYAFDWDGERRIRIVSDSMEMDPEVVAEDYRQDNRPVSWKIDQSDGAGAEASFEQDLRFEESNRPYSARNGGEMFGSRYREDSPNGDFHLLDEQEAGSSFSSSVSDDLSFNRYLTEANDLLKEAKECIRGRRDEEHAEVVLYKSAKLLSKAIALKPMSLLAVGQLGNTYLLHGELKLKISRELRATLSTWGPLSFESRGSSRMERDELRRKDKLVEVLTGVCEECEELLVEAGKKYKLALSIDGNDVRALYNWGLALSFRAQLIADVGPEAAFDADKLFLAATDKFDAMMSKSNVHAPDALFRWGAVLQQRSRLRPPSSKAKVKLLQQARRLYEDALNMDSNNVQVREALSSCTTELNRRLFRSF